MQGGESAKVSFLRSPSSLYKSSLPSLGVTLFLIFRYDLAHHVFTPDSG
jgi:hypothetical protein